MTPIKTLLFVVFIALFSVPCLAQNTSDSHYQAAEELLQQMDMQLILTQSIDGMIDAQVRANPQMLMFEDIMKSFMQKYMSWESLKDVYIEIYIEEFMESELRDITAFYQTETGKKAIQRTPVIMQKGMEIGEQVMTQHLPELERLIMERVQQMEEAY